MNRKTLTVIIIFLLILALFLFFWLRRSKPTIEVPSGETCLVFQNTDPLAPCYSTSLANNPIPGGTASSSGNFPVENTPVTLISSTCPSSNTFEKNDCISHIAEEKKDKTFCGYIVGSLAQQSCVNNVQSPSVSPIVNTPSPIGQTSTSYQAFVEQYFSNTKKPIVGSGTTSPSGSVYSEPQKVATTSADETKFVYNLSFGAPLTVYAPSKYQVAPNDSVKIYGVGFLPSENILNFGVFQTTLGSTDGTTLLATAPATTGEYEIWVTNQKGSSRTTSRPIKITVTNSPAPLPVIEKATPSIVPVDGTVTLSGTGFSSSNNLFTSYGNLMSVPSNGNTISFSLSSLPYISYAKAASELKGRISPILVNIQSAGGVNETVFQFNVQF